MSEAGAMDSGDVARLVAVLLVTDDHELEGFRRRCLGRDSELAVERLKLARDVLLRVGRTLGTTEDAAWSALASVGDTLSREAPGAGPDLVPGLVGSGPAPGALASSLPGVASGALAAPPSPAVDGPEAVRLPAPPPLPAAPPRVRQNSSPWAQTPEAPVRPAAEPPPPPVAAPIDETVPEPLALAHPLSYTSPAISEPAPRPRTSAIPFEAKLALKERVATPFESRIPPVERSPNDAPRLDGLPFARASSPPPPSASPAKAGPAPVGRELSIEEFAWISVHVEQFGPAAPFGPEYGIRDLVDWRGVVERWEGRLAEDAALRTRHEQLLAQYREWLAQKR